MKCIGTCKCEDGEYRLYVYIEERKFFVLLPNFKITMYMNNNAIPDKAKQTFARRMRDYDEGKIQFRG